jgi:hypothetical protein
MKDQISELVIGYCKPEEVDEFVAKATDRLKELFLIKGCSTEEDIELFWTIINLLQAWIVRHFAVVEQNKHEDVIWYVLSNIEAVLHMNAQYFK